MANRNRLTNILLGVVAVSSIAGVGLSVANLAYNMQDAADVPVGAYVLPDFSIPEFPPVYDI